MSSDSSNNGTERGDAQQLGYLKEARKQVELAIQLHEGGFSDPALARADTAAGHLEGYRKGPVQRREADAHTDNE